MDSLFNDIICIECGVALHEPSLQGDWLTCHACGQRYPLISGRIPVLMKDAPVYLASLYLQHHRYLRRQEERIAALKAAGNESPERLEVLSLIAKGLDENNKVIESACNELSGHISIADLVQAVNAPQFIGYTSIFEYLERDWCWLPAGEKELSTIRDALFEQTDHYSPDDKNVLVLGAGTGRIAWDLLDRFERVYALDISLTMAQCLHNVLNEGVTFRSVNTSSISRSMDMVKTRKARAVPPGSPGACDEQVRRRLAYLVGDACRAPFAERSISVIVSAYFTDVMPLRQYFEEIRRVLKPRGLFLHFGPLEYHFDDISQHLSAEQVRQLFEENGFEVYADEYTANKHLSSEGSMSRQAFDNWVFGAVLTQEKRARPDFYLGEETVLRLAEDVQYLRSGLISAEGESIADVQLLLCSGEHFREAKTLYGILKMLDGRKSIKDILGLLFPTNSEFNKQDLSAALAFLNRLAKEGALEVVGFDD
ncbi:MAG: methyltransferase domain-containing protein [Pseudomonadota bacterium]|nr:methyltransferase domain-containing protein [Pseudomonadota bacterium]